MYPCGDKCILPKKEVIEEEKKEIITDDATETEKQLPEESTLPEKKQLSYSEILADLITDKVLEVLEKFAAETEVEESNKPRETEEEPPDKFEKEQSVKMDQLNEFDDINLLLVNFF